MTITLTSLLRPLVLAGFVLSPLAAAAQEAGPAAPATPRASAAAGGVQSSQGTRPWQEAEYRLGPGDKLRVEVYGEPQLSQSLQIRPDGKITLPLVDDVQAAGRTSLELRDSLSQALGEYVNNPVVTVIVQEATANLVYVLGEVSTQGPQVLAGPITVLQAIAQAGGLSPFASKGRIRILRPKGSTIETIQFNYNDAVNGRLAPVFLQPGDTVMVP
jgi:polysaccharide biosynthesis/export protein